MASPHEHLAAMLATGSLPVVATVNDQDMIDVFNELMKDPELTAAMQLAPRLRSTLLQLEVSPTNAIQALAFTIGLIAKHDLEEGPDQALLAAAAPIVFGNLNTRTS